MVRGELGIFQLNLISLDLEISNPTCKDQIGLGHRVDTILLGLKLGFHLTI